MSSGDSGVGPDTCWGEDGKIFDPDFASTCPYVLSVGSTEWDRFDASVPPTPGKKLNEIATRRFPSGGGFSNVFGIPNYQRDAVSAYFDQVEKTLGFSGYHHFVENGNFSSVTGGVYHHGGRAYPDVGAVGDRQVVYSNGSWWLVGGTSLSAPVWGAVLTLVNEARIEAGKGPVGFIHPILVGFVLLANFGLGFSSLIETDADMELCSINTQRHSPISLLVATLDAARLVSQRPQDGIPLLALGKCLGTLIEAL
jgi:tripeptidyl-peptidase-1